MGKDERPFLSETRTQVQKFGWMLGYNSAPSSSPLTMDLRCFSASATSPRLRNAFSCYLDLFLNMNCLIWENGGEQTQCGKHSCPGPMDGVVGSPLSSPRHNFCLAWGSSYQSRNGTKQAPEPVPLCPLAG